jgi:hypothetical protein
MKSTFLVALTALTLLSSSASAAEQTRESYVASVEPICKSNKTASDRYLTGIGKLVRRDKLVNAGVNFLKAAIALEKTQKQLALVPQPTADATRLARWLAGIRAEVALMKKIATNLKKDTKAGKTKATTLSVKLTHDATATNNQVIVFSFNYCKIDPSRYS